MSKLKSFVASAMVIAGVASTNAQQAIKNRTSDTVMKHLALANGTNPSVITGTNNINHGQSGDKSSVLVRTPSGQFLDHLGFNNGSTTISNETIGNNTISFTDATQTTRQNPTNESILLTFIAKDGRTDTNNDGIRDGHFTHWTLPTLQTNGAAIPHGTRVRLTTPTLTNLADGSNILGGRDDRLERDETINNRVDITTNPNGSPENNNRVDRVEYLGVDTNEMTAASIYPNPATDRITIATPDDASAKKLEIYSIAGQRISSMITPAGSTEHTIDLTGLTPGVYILTSDNEQGQKTMNKIIKK